MLSLYTLLTAVPLVYATNTTSVWNNGRAPTQAPESDGVAGRPSSVQHTPAGTTYTTTYVTDVLTTFCSTPTTITSNGQTITVTAPTTVTITGPCTVTSTGTSAPGHSSSPINQEAVATQTTTTEIVKTLTTYVTGPTTLTTNGGTYTATEATTLTITDCPCTLTKTASAPFQNGTVAGIDTSLPTASSTAVQSFETYVTGATTIKANGKTYTATEATTLTITDCSCTETPSANEATSTTPGNAAAATTAGGVTGTHTLFETETTQIVETRTSTPAGQESGTPTVYVVTVTEGFAHAAPESSSPAEVATGSSEEAGLATTSEQAPVAGPTETDFITTKVYKTLTTYVTGPTTLTTNGGTYTATEATTLTITDCPCTVTSQATSEGAGSYNGTNNAASASASSPGVESEPALANGARVNMASYATVLGGLVALGSLLL